MPRLEAPPRISHCSMTVKLFTNFESLSDTMSCIRLTDCPILPEQHAAQVLTILTSRTSNAPRDMRSDASRTPAGQGRSRRAFSGRGEEYHDIYVMTRMCIIVSENLVRIVSEPHEQQVRRFARDSFTSNAAPLIRHRHVFRKTFGRPRTATGRTAGTPVAIERSNVVTCLATAALRLRRSAATGSTTGLRRSLNISRTYCSGWLPRAVT